MRGAEWGAVEISGGEPCIRFNHYANGLGSTAFTFIIATWGDDPGNFPRVHEPNKTGVVSRGNFFSAIKFVGNVSALRVATPMNGKFVHED